MNTPNPSESTQTCPAYKSIFYFWGTRRLRLLFLGPLAISIVVIILLLSIFLYQQENKKLQHGMIQINTAAQNFYKESIHYDAMVLQALMHTLERDTKLQTNLVKLDRETLLKNTKPLFEDLRRDFNITHFYFSGPDRVNLLRVHSPPRHGDIINRITTLQAERSGTSAYGVELGPLGTFTLRLVSPWFEEHSHRLIGYVELGMEIDQVFNKLEDFFGIQVITTVYKTFLQQEKWEAGMQALGRSPNWERFPEIVTSEWSTNKEISSWIAEHLAHEKLAHINTRVEVTHAGHIYQISHLPLRDAGGRMVAQMILFNEVTTEISGLWRTIFIGSFAMIIAGASLFFLFYWLIGKIGERIEHDQEKMQKLATHDGLTGLYNHRTFYSLLDDEIRRSLRNGRPLALLMLDIDHFKQVNDSYGHRVGDTILRGLSDLLMEQARETDRVCRYGGEEITLILPEIDSDEVMEVAERLRGVVETHTFDTGDGRRIPITVSIGAASYPHDADTKETLVATADSALYQAKQDGRNRVCRYGKASASP